MSRPAEWGAAPRRLMIERNHTMGEIMGTMVLQSARESGGRRTLVELEVAPGRGLAQHLHRRLEATVTCVAGQLTVMRSGFPYELRPGQEVTAPAGIRHAWRNDEPAPALALVEVRPGHAGVERALRVVDGLAADGRTRPDGTPRNLLHSALLLRWSEARLPGARGAVAPVMVLLAAAARMRGIDRELIERYA